ncbi:thioredoxin family protein [Candidatus Saccharibacteria bacterium]|nr:thioredoxin family protein [Candidatus Saccharibacteria bacterium]
MSKTDDSASKTAADKAKQSTVRSSAHRTTSTDDSQPEHCSGCNCHNREKSAPYYHCGGNVVVVCIFTAMLTAILVVLIFAFCLSTFAKSYSANHAPINNYQSGRYEDAVARETGADSGDEVDLGNVAGRKINLDAVAMLDYLSRDESAFIMLSTKDCAECNALSENVEKLLISHPTATVYETIVDNHTSLTDDESRVVEALSTDDRYPAFLYLKDGCVYDRLDNLNDEDALKTFIEKYSQS